MMPLSGVMHTPHAGTLKPPSGETTTSGLHLPAHCRLCSHAVPSGNVPGMPAHAPCSKSSEQPGAWISCLHCANSASVHDDPGKASEAHASDVRATHAAWSPP
jgi:hypothetical protein